MNQTNKVAEQHAQETVSHIIQVQALTAHNFAPFGEVIACQGNDFFHINDAHTERYHALVATEANGDAKTGISIFRNIRATHFPVNIEMLERHPQGSQAFIPMQGQAFLIVVAPTLNADQPDITQLCAFISNGSQGVNYRAGTWHHPLLTFEAPSDFAVIDRIGTGSNCDIYQFPMPLTVQY
ncbi:ureidoglycolate lyase [Acinetobacter sp. CFCC 10889]|uniref:ureidoglycolate lyase n=1 Tax=Acinetobacter sp. CFCC 10889 TaxID=1775557 RepID=UPI000DD00494|nr:ureidoglycolate lyase [Acinetobacter sp. CFCC 10889]